MKKEIEKIQETIVNERHAGHIVNLRYGYMLKKWEIIEERFQRRIAAYAQELRQIEAKIKEVGGRVDTTPESIRKAWGYSFRTPFPAPDGKAGPRKLRVGFGLSNIFGAYGQDSEMLKHSLEEKKKELEFLRVECQRLQVLRVGLQEKKKKQNEQVEDLE
jgi:hypothetical protein